MLPGRSARGLHQWDRGPHRASGQAIRHDLRNDRLRVKPAHSIAERVTDIVWTLGTYHTVSKGDRLFLELCMAVHGQVGTMASASAA